MILIIWDQLDQNLTTSLLGDLFLRFKYAMVVTDFVKFISERLICNAAHIFNGKLYL